MVKKRRFYYLINILVVFSPFYSKGFYFLGIEAVQKEYFA